MSNWERALRNIAEGARWELPALGQVKMSLEQLSTLMTRVASDTGFTGDTDTAAVSGLDEARSSVQDMITYLDNLPDIVEVANGRRDEAQQMLSQLDSGGLSPEQTTAIRAAAAGTTVVLGPFSVVAGEGAIAAANWFMGDQREKQAQKAVEEMSNRLDQDGQTLSPPRRSSSRLRTATAATAEMAEAHRPTSAGLARAAVRATSSIRTTTCPAGAAPTSPASTEGRAPSSPILGPRTSRRCTRCPSPCG